MFYKSLRVLVVDPVQSTRTLLKLWVGSEAEALGIPCCVELLAELPVPLSHGALIFSPSFAAGSVPADLASLCCAYGEPSSARGGRYMPWPLKRAQVRRMLVEAAVLFGEAVPQQEGAPFGHPLPAELTELSPKLQSSVRALYTECEQALHAGKYVAGGRCAHTLKGAAMSFGQLVLVEIARALQEFFEREDRDAVAHWLSVLQRLL